MANTPIYDLCPTDHAISEPVSRSPSPLRSPSPDETPNCSPSAPTMPLCKTPPPVPGDSKTPGTARLSAGLEKATNVEEQITYLVKAQGVGWLRVTVQEAVEYEEVGYDILSWPGCMAMSMQDEIVKQQQTGTFGDGDKNKTSNARKDDESDAGDVCEAFAEDMDP